MVTTESSTTSRISTASRRAREPPEREDVSSDSGSSVRSVSGCDGTGGRSIDAGPAASPCADDLARPPEDVPGQRSVATSGTRSARPSGGAKPHHHAGVEPPDLGGPQTGARDLVLQGHDLPFSAELHQRDPSRREVHADDLEALPGD